MRFDCITTDLQQMRGMPCIRGPRISVVIIMALKGRRELRADTGTTEKPILAWTTKGDIDISGHRGREEGAS